MKTTEPGRWLRVKMALAALAAVGLLTGCATSKPMDKASASSMKGQTLAKNNRISPGMMDMGAGRGYAGLGLVGAMMAIAAMKDGGRSIVDGYKLVDPADAILASLAQAMVTTHGVQLVPSPPTIGAVEPAEIAANANGTARYVLDVGTTDWEFGNFPHEWSKYRVVYFAKVQLIDVRTSDVLAKGVCDYKPEDASTAPGRAELHSGGRGVLRPR